MRWAPGGSDSDIEDRRGASGGFGRVPFGGRGLGLGGIIVVGLLSLIFRQNFFSLFDGSGGVAPSTESAPPASQTPEEQQRYEFVKFVMNDVQDTWSKVLPADARVQYPHAKLVLFRDAVQSGCGVAESATGPFYCPNDQKVYIDLSFYDELKQRFGASGDFAQAYVIAHEVGHHVQNLLGLMDQLQAGGGNAASVQVELQADCLAGVWGHSTAQRNILDPGDVEEAMNAAAAIGDDRIQKMQGQQVHPEGFTHGSSAQRLNAFRRGMDDGSLAGCGNSR
jgi:predicted metalloprotease